MLRNRRRHVDPIRVHSISLAIFGVIAAAALMVWMFPRFFFAIVLVAASVFVYQRLYTFIEARLEAEEGRLAEELGFDLDDEDAEPPPARRKKKKTVAADTNGTVATPAEPPAATSPTIPSSESTT